MKLRNPIKIHILSRLHVLTVDKCIRFNQTDKWNYEDKVISFLYLCPIVLNVIQKRNKRTMYAQTKGIVITDSCHIPTF